MIVEYTVHDPSNTCVDKPNVIFFTTLHNLKSIFKVMIFIFINKRCYKLCIFYFNKTSLVDKFDSVTDYHSIYQK